MQPIKEETFYASEPNLPFTVFTSDNHKAEMHWHTFIELLYVIRGSIRIKIGESEYIAYPGDFYIINSQEIHLTEWLSPVKDRQVLVIQFEPSVIDSNLGLFFEFKYIMPFLKNELIYAKYIKVDEKNDFKVILTHILHEFRNKEPGYELEIKGNIFRIFSWLIRNNYIIISTILNSKVDNLMKLRDLLEYIENKYYEQISMKKAAKMVCMSDSHFCRFFKSTMGKSFTEYVNFVRLKESEKLLISTNKSITEIAMEVGYSSVGYFDRFFKKEKGISPLLYKKQNSTTFEQK
jgi:AraC-like DNA-binding protein